MATMTLTLPDVENGPITEEQFEDLPEPDLFYFELVHQFVNRGGKFEPELEIELSKLTSS